ncbi:HpcH/HpaI aldolase/citrate lyase family protein [Nocardioides sp. NPDC051685]|uniref:HpcH/HpaI aldolase/citrate lyase family protein n=1 Tax=Nocardioides sp. NPDC051685 TaxID=3364334 RepID=UPI0037AF1A01
MHVPGIRTKLTSMIDSGQTPLGAWITSSDPSTSMILGSVGYDFLVIDDEHGVLGPRDILNHVRSAWATGIPALQRVGANDLRSIQRALDTGADGVIVPKVGTAEQAQRAVKASRYEPAGRGMCPVVPATTWSQDNWAEYVEIANREVTVVPLIETVEGVRNFAEIAAVDGIDFAFFGYADLALDLGVDMYADRAQLEPLWEEMKQIAAGAGVRLGMPLGSGLEGTTWGTAGSDLNLLRSTARDALLAARQRYTPAGSSKGVG